ncbi:50S ribosomal protein L13 [Marinisporobacter balticus]|uniref:Large ribosomal subunit protein uL13 n=1 Tax=Marinisporobacter balticus TaxID=2018667 RepID=A0A4V2SBC5_9FIRM|nr:50S ribosomal protein L13 [Marinisporobacter balticus]TCO74980.1 LSU ribosomal protein L13P [Marinisporobacter balticus]
MKSFIAKPQEVERKWYVVDAEGKTLGRLASQVASILRGKNKPIYTPHVDTGDHVIIINAEKIQVTGKKMDQKLYRHHTGYVGNLKEVTYKQMLQKHPERIIEFAVKGMLPKNSLGRAMFKKLKVNVGAEHKHEAQKPEVLDI